MLKDSCLDKQHNECRFLAWQAGRSIVKSSLACLEARWKCCPMTCLDVRSLASKWLACQATRCINIWYVFNKQLDFWLQFTDFQVARYSASSFALLCSKIFPKIMKILFLKWARKISKMCPINFEEQKFWKFSNFENVLKNFENVPKNFDYYENVPMKFCKYAQNFLKICSNFLKILKICPIFFKMCRNNFKNFKLKICPKILILKMCPKSFENMP
jgi:hypothetical protein